jgi:hypothetical protein
MGEEILKFPLLYFYYNLTMHIRPVTKRDIFK